MSLFIWTPFKKIQHLNTSSLLMDPHRDSVNSGTADTCKSSNSSSSLAYKTEGHTPNSSTALLTETPFTFPTQQSALIMEYPQHTSMLSVGYYSQDVTHMGLMGTVVAQNMEEEVDDDGLTENPAFAQQGMEHKVSSVGPLPPPPPPPPLYQPCMSRCPE